MMVSRVTFAAGILTPLNPVSVLDVGCRDGELSKHLKGVEYHGADLLPGKTVSYVGDVTKMDFGRTFDCVVACDILEHLESPSRMFDRLVRVMDRHMLISLPNTYDLKSIGKFLRRDMGAKYRFAAVEPVDRHRWIMSREEICNWSRAKAEEHTLGLRLFDLTYGEGGSMSGKFLSAVLPKPLTTATVFALFSHE